MSDHRVILRTERLQKFFGGVHAVDEVALSVPEGQRRAIIGPNGAGKTTLFNLVSGHLRPDRGAIYIRGQRINEYSPQRICHLGLSRTFQITSIFPRLKVYENVLAAILVHEKKSFNLVYPASRMARATTEALVRLVGLEDAAGQVSGTLSHGDQKRLELAIALASEPKLLLLDEPTAGMAPQEKAETMALIDTIAREKGLTILFTEHDMDVVFGHAECITVMHQGRILAEGDAQEVRANEAVQRIYLGEEL
jgi:branched-chain amino acid transport system ATP-binding protein